MAIPAVLGQLIQVSVPPAPNTSSPGCRSCFLGLLQLP